MTTRATVRQIVKSNRTPAILAALYKAKGSYVTVGVHRGAGQYEGDNAPTVDKVALWLEYGTENMPARPFLYPSVARNKAAIAKLTAKSLVNIAYLKGTVAQGLASIGYKVVGFIQNTIKSNVGPPLSGSWDPPKGYLGWRREHYPEQGQRTLFASGLLLRSVSFVVHLTDSAKADQAAAVAKNPPKPGRDEFGRFLKRKAQPGRDEHGKFIRRAPDRAAARNAATALKEQRRTQRQHANANPEAHAAAFQNQRRVYTRAKGPHE